MSFREYKKSLSCLSNRIVFQINKSSHHRTAVNNSLTVKVTVSCCLKQRLNLHSDRNFNCNILINVTADCYILLSNRLTVCNCTVNVINSFNVNNHYSYHYRDCSLRNNLACCFICKYNFVTGRINVRNFLNSYLCTLK